MGTLAETVKSDTLSVTKTAKWRKKL